MVDRQTKRRLHDPYRWTGTLSRVPKEGDEEDSDRMSYYSRLLKPWGRAARNFDHWPRLKLSEEQLEARLESRVAELVSEKIQHLQKTNAELKYINNRRMP
jgi:hypothetical protein